jgi:hypothetical protein
MIREDMFRQFIFGETVISNKPFSNDEFAKILARGKKAAADAPFVPTEKTLALFGRLSRAWQDPSYPKRKEAHLALRKSTGFSAELIKAALDKFPGMLAPETLNKKIEGELGSAAILDKPVVQPSTGTRLIFRPAGQVLHVASGNVFLASIDSLIDGVITKNVNYLKMSSEERDFAVIFARSIKEFDADNVTAPRLAVFWWHGGDDNIEGLFKQGMDRIVFWGGYDALVNWERGIGEATTLVRHGPKISFGVISKQGLAAADLPELTDRMAFDISIWEQRACNCPQAVFVDESIADDRMKLFLDSLAGSMRKITAHIPPAERSSDEHVEILRARELALARSIVTGGETRIDGPGTLEWTVIYNKGQAKDDGAEVSPLNRTILVKRYRSLEGLAGLLRQRSFYLQTIGYCLAENEIQDYAAALSAAGVTRLCPFGVMAIPTPGAPHDGAYALRDLTRAAVIG